MAKYTINHRCGHSRVMQLYGPEIDRQRKITWMEGQSCPSCWGKEKAEEEAKKPIAISVATNGVDTDTAGNLLVEVILSGGTKPRKDEIKALGYAWTEVRGGMLDWFADRAQMAWTKQIPLDFDGKFIEIVKADAQALGVEKIDHRIGPLDIAAAKKTIARRQEALAAKPARPDCHPRAQHPTGRWNGEYYGQAKYKNLRYYIDGEEYKLTEDEYKQCITYRKAIDAWKQKYPNIK